MPWLQILLAAVTVIPTAYLIIRIVKRRRAKKKAQEKRLAEALDKLQDIL